MPAMLGNVLKFTILFLGVLVLVSCGTKSTYPTADNHNVSAKTGPPPAYVQKAWDARYSYDADRRLLVPQYAGSRWGAVQQYKEEGELVYQDWWIRDVRSEDLEASPDTAITSFINEDGNLTFIPQDTEDPSVEANASDGEQGDVFDTDDLSDESLPVSSDGEESPFVPSPFSPF